MGQRLAHARVRGRRRAVSIAGATLAVAVLSLLTGCSESGTVTARHLSSVVADRIHARVGVNVRVDCGAEPVSRADGTRAHCTVSEGDRRYDALVRIVNPQNSDHFTVQLAVSSAPKGS
ncbi:hypothetical protein [Humibacter ginsenosidimutans]|uniref:DUF4333 domain-containing protein n=1 Tax=Humibacter ginsenosidimutans TaxID=2599293 RepID=A0A5B8M8H0_9MICO|nr:hypothetical protein [Humibacter ginsenosidimutans]QDZ16344.1 hypothetical protein FPZ11_17715 [Humibacter ginsenosidimutans]